MSETLIVAKKFGPCLSPRCPHCQNGLQNQFIYDPNSPNGVSLTIMCCTDCKRRFLFDPQTAIEAGMKDYLNGKKMEYPITYEGQLMKAGYIKSYIDDHS